MGEALKHVDVLMACPYHMLALFGHHRLDSNAQGDVKAFFSSLTRSKELIIELLAIKEAMKIFK